MKYQDYIPLKTVHGFLESLKKRHQIPADGFELWDLDKFEKMLLVYHYKDDSVRVIFDTVPLTERCANLDYLKKNMKVSRADPVKEINIYRRIVLE